MLRAALELYRANPDFAIQLSVQPDDTPGLQRIAEISSPRSPRRGSGRASGRSSTS